MISDQLGPVADVPPFAESTRSQLRSMDISLAGDANPVDLTGMFFAHIDRLDEVIATATGDEGIDGAVLYFTFGDQLIETYRSLAASLPERAEPTWFVWAGAPEGEVEAQAATGRVVGSIPDLVRSVAAHPRSLPVEGLVDGRRSALGDRTALPAGRVLTEADLAPVLSGWGLEYVPMAVAALGVQAVLTDPTGAPVGAWQPGTFPGFTVLGEPGTPAWFELHTRDHGRAVAFYREAFRWETQAVGDTDDFRYTVMLDPGGGESLAGIFDARRVLAEGEPSGWSVYWTVADADAAVARVTSLGGSVAAPPEDTTYGRMATVADPAGAPFRLQQVRE